VSEQESFHPIDVTFLLHAAELLEGDPQVDDLGPLYAAVARVNTPGMEGAI
jgi:death-on-curing protein